MDLWQDRDPGAAGCPPVSQEQVREGRPAPQPPCLHLWYLEAGCLV